MKQYLSNCLSKINIKITDRQLEQFEIFYNFLIEKNKVMNLTAITDMEEVVKKHFVDSVVILNYISIDGLSVIDVGTGAGFPGIPLAIMCPNTNFMLLDSLNKRVLFIEETIEKCNLSNVSVIHSRAEDGGKNIGLREKYDLCVSRAVANMSVLLEYSSPFVRLGGQFISYKSGDVEEELQSSVRAQKILNCQLDRLIQFDLFKEIHRSFVIYNKVGKTPKMYPRQAGKAKKDPL